MKPLDPFKPGSSGVVKRWLSSPRGCASKGVQERLDSARAGEKRDHHAIGSNYRHSLHPCRWIRIGPGIHLYQTRKRDRDRKDFCRNDRLGNQRCVVRDHAAVPHDCILKKQPRKDPAEQKNREMIRSIFRPQSASRSEHHREHERITHQQDQRMDHRPEKAGHGTNVAMLQVSQHQVLNKVAIGRKLSEQPKHHRRLYRTNFPFERVAITTSTPAT